MSNRTGFLSRISRISRSFKLTMNQIFQNFHRASLRDVIDICLIILLITLVILLFSELKAIKSPDDLLAGRIIDEYSESCFLRVDNNRHFLYLPIDVKPVEESENFDRLLLVFVGTSNEIDIDGYKKECDFISDNVRKLRQDYNK